MADRSLTEAVGEIRLSDSKLAADLALIKRKLLQQVQNLERDAAIPLGVKIDERSVRDELAKVRKTAAATDISAPVRLSTADAEQDLATFQGAVSSLPPVVVPVDIDADQLASQVSTATNLASTQIQPAFQTLGNEGGEAFGVGFGNSLKGAIQPIALAATGFLATALFKGFQRFTTIQDATTSLTVALGDATQAAAVLGEVLDVVRGTPFNLDQFARAASSLISFGVEAERVPGYLTAIGEASATQGGRANEFAQRLSDVYGRATAIGRLSGDDIWSFAGVGVNALAILGNQFGKTTEEIQTMVSEGAIPAEQGLAALSDGILNGTDGINGATNAFAGTMEALRLTLTGALGGFSASTARFGAAIITPLNEVLVEVVNASTSIVDALSGEVGEALSGFAESEGAQNFIEFLRTVPDEIGPFIDKVLEIGPALAPVAAAVTALGAGGLGSIIPGNLGAPLVALAGPLGLIGSALAAIVATTPELRDAFIPVITELGEELGALGADLGTTLGDAVESSIPIIEKLIEILGDMVPLIGVVAELGATLATVLVPALGALAAVVDFIPVEVFSTLLTVFIGYKAISFVGGVLDSIGASFERLSKSGAGDKLANTLSGGLRQTAENSSRSERAITKSTTAIGGALSGLALQAEDSGTRIAGALGAATSIAAGFATGGPVGGAVAIAGVGVGLLAGALQNSATQAAAVQAKTDEMSRALGDATQEFVNATAAADTYTSSLSATEASTKQLGESILQSGEDGEKLGIALNSIGLSSDGLAGAENAVRVLKQIGAFGDPDGDVSKVPEIMEALDAAFGDAAQGVADLISKEDDIDVIMFKLAFLDGIDFKNLTAEQIALVESIEELQDQSEKTDLTNLITQTIAYNASQSERYRQALIIAEQETGTSRATTDLAEAEALRIETLRVLQEETMRLDRLTADAKLRDAGLTETQIKTYIDLADQLRVPISTLVNLDTGEAVQAGEELQESFEELELPETVITNADRLAAALEDSNDALGVMSTTLDGIEGKISTISTLQDFNQGFRDVGDFFGSIINDDDIENAQKLTAEIEKQRDTIKDLSADVDTARAEARVEVALLDEQLQRAEAAGATKGAAALRAEIDRVNLEAQQKENELAEAITELQGYEAEFRRISQTPITVLQELKNQAAEQGISFYDLLVQAPTPEAQEAFDLLIEGQVNNALGQVQALIDAGDPQGAARLAEKLKEDLKAGFIGQGLDPATAQSIIDNLFPVDALGEQAQTAALALSITESLQIALDREGGVEIEVRPTFADAFGTPLGQKTLDEYILENATTAATPSGGTRDSFRPGRNIPQADGGILEFFRDGGVKMPERHIAQIVPAGSWRIFGEPETGGEGYIPLSPFKRERSTQVLTSIADMFGLSVVPKEMDLPVKLQPSGAPPMGFSEEAMARAVERGVKQAQAGRLAQRQRAADGAARSVTVEKIEVSGVKDPSKAVNKMIRRLSDVALRMSDDWDGI